MFSLQNALVMIFISALMEMMEDFYLSHKTKVVFLSFLASFVVLSTFDVSTDLYQAYEYYFDK